jgi:hypothetical protein
MNDQNQDLEVAEPEQPSKWERRFENEINTFFDESITRVPTFVDRHLKSFRHIMGRSLGPKTGIGDVFVTAKNLASGISSSLGGPDFSSTTYTHDKLTEAFHKEVVSPGELESLIERLFHEFEEEKWNDLEDSLDRNLDEDGLREQLVDRMEEAIAHDPLLAQTLRSGVKIGIPATLGYMLFGNPELFSKVQTSVTENLKRSKLNNYREMFGRLGEFKVPGWLGALGWAGGVVGSLALGGVMEFALNSVRDIKGAYIRQLNRARHILLYGENPDVPEGRGLIHIVRGLEDKFDELSELDE